MLKFDLKPVMAALLYYRNIVLLYMFYLFSSLKGNQ